MYFQEHHTVDTDTNPSPKSNMCPTCGQTAPQDSDFVLIDAIQNSIAVKGHILEFTPMQMKLFLLLYNAKSRTITYEYMIQNLYPIPDDEPDAVSKIITVYICSIRRIISKASLSKIMQIKSKHAVGYSMKVIEN